MQGTRLVGGAIGRPARNRSRRAAPSLRTVEADDLVDLERSVARDLVLGVEEADRP